MANTLFFKRAIEDYIIDTLIAVTGLDDIKFWLRGALPSGIGPVALDYYPYGEVWIPHEGEAEPDPQWTGNYYNQLYEGAINVSLLLVDTSGVNDWADVIAARKLTLPSYDRLEEYAYYIQSELQKCEHKDLGTLVLNDEAAGELTITDVAYGFDRNERVNTWEQFGSLEFQVTSVKQED